jgi:hypothetical protein
VRKRFTGRSGAQKVDISCPLSEVRNSEGLEQKCSFFLLIRTGYFEEEIMSRFIAICLALPLAVLALTSCAPTTGAGGANPAAQRLADCSVFP